ncbi:MAG: hypothetical protein GSR84_03005 [Desulfurococcales archaeon]|nr:hypothetical protein [Desulfurococcales archaeon]
MGPRLRSRKALSDIIAVVAVIAVALVGVAFVHNNANGVMQSFSSARLSVVVDPVYPQNGLLLNIEVRNAGDSNAQIIDVRIDNTSIAASIPWNGTTLAPGGSIVDTIDVSSLNLQPGRHVLTIVYIDHGEVREKSVEFIV